ncbi:MAG: murein biosynthesis integral membrane protein MurJ [Candidatus Sumerlaeaceae bacterium]|nr:murein biosynthesis integral membrane protein MurJ [Candidatus Sumerlaeaceae bacterium]
MGRTAKNTAIFSALTLLSRLSGVLRVMMFAYILGGGRLNDAYQLANTIPNIIYEFIMGGLLSAIFIPVLVRAQEEKGKSSAEAWRVANLLVGYVGAILAVVSLIGVLLSPVIIDGMTFLAREPGAVASRDQATTFFRYFAPQMLFYGLNAVFMAILNSHEIFAITAAAPILNNVVVIVTLWAFGHGWIGPTGLAIGTTAGIAAMALVQMPWLVKIRMPIRPLFDFRDPLFRAIGALGVPVVAVSIANLISTAVRANLLYTEAGGFTAYSFCFILIMMPYGIFAVSIATVLYPQLARQSADGNQPAFRETMARGLRHTAFIMLPIALGMSLLAEPMTRVLFERGNFSPAHSAYTARFLALYALSILPYALLMFGSRAFYATKDTLTPAWINVGGVVLNVCLNFALMHFMGVAGIALASTITYLCTMGVSICLLRRQHGPLGGTPLLVAIGKMFAAAACMGLVLSAGLRMTEPEVTSLHRGARTKLILPAFDTKGHVIPITKAQDWRELWTRLGEDYRIPEVDFSRQTVIAIFGPRSETTSSLDLRRKEIAGDGTVLFHVDVRESTSKPTATDKPDTRPPFLLVKVNSTVTAANAEFTPVTSASRGAFSRMIQAPELGRLLLLVALGSAIYLGLAWLLRVEEVRAVFLRFTKTVI